MQIGTWAHNDMLKFTNISETGKEGCGRSSNAKNKTAHENAWLERSKWVPNRTSCDFEYSEQHTNRLGVCLLLKTSFDNSHPACNNNTALRCHKAHTSLESTALVAVLQEGAAIYHLCLNYLSFLKATVTVLVIYLRLLGSSKGDILSNCFLLS